MSAPRLQISKTLRDRMNYAKCAAEKLRMLVLESRYWLDTACAHAAQHLDWQVNSCPVVAAGLLPREQIADLLTTLVEFQPDFILTINHSGMDRAGLFAHLFADLGVPLVTWFVDDPRTILMNDAVHATPYALALTWERAYESYLRSAGFQHVHHLSLAADTRFQGTPNATPEMRGAFVGNSMIEFAQRERRELTAHPDLLAAIDAAFEQGKVTRQNFARGLDAILGETLNRSLDEEARRHAEIYCFVEGTRRLRHQLAQRLSPEGMNVRGDEQWLSVIPNAGPPVHYENDLPALYRNTAVNLNTTSIQMATAVNQRVFDCPAAGGFLLTDAQPDMHDLFEPGVNAEIYHNLDECHDKFRYYTQHPEQRIPIIQAAQHHIAQNHTYHHRLQSLATILRAIFSD